MARRKGKSLNRVEFIGNLTENMDIQEDRQHKKKKNSFDAIRKGEKEKRRLRRARIIIRNISYKANDDLLRQHFAKFGNITELNLIKRSDGKLVGCAFIQYEKVNEAAKAILQASNKEFLGRPVFIDWAIGKNEFIKRKGKDKIKQEPTDRSQVKNGKNSVSGDVDVYKKEESDDADSDAKIKKEENDDSGETASADGSEDGDTKAAVTIECTGEPKTKQKSNDILEGCTVFIKNVPFDATTDDLKECCRKFGSVCYALINTDPISGHSRGTAFVKFKTKESADMCLNAGAEFALFETILEQHPALSREEAKNRTIAVNQNKTTDSRNLYLVKEGLIMSGSKAAQDVSASDMSKRHKLEQIKAQILKNLNRFVSRNRLSIHNLPLHFDDDKLRKMVIKFTEFKPHECRVMRENKQSVGHPKGKSKGFGFMSFKTHQEALIALRKLNNNPTIFTKANRPIVTFSIEDRPVHKIKEKRLKRSRENNPMYKNKLEKLKEIKNKKKAVDKYDESKIQKDVEIVKTIAKENSAHAKYEQELEDFSGVPSKPSSFIRMRSNRKIKEQSREHLKRLSERKRKKKQRKERFLHRTEKNLMDQPKIGNKKTEEDNFSLLVERYKKLLERRIDTAATITRRSKWYDE